MQNETIKIRSPGKLILSGEHAVVYGKPALAVAIDLYAETTIARHHTEEVLIKLTNFDYMHSFSLEGLRKLKKKIKQKYHAFLKGEIHIKRVLKKPFELMHYVLGHWIEHIQVEKPDLHIDTHSTIPPGCGLGSSAATILSVFYGLSHFHKMPMSQEQCFNLALEAEQLQHGKTNGLDLYISLHGGCVYFKDGETESRPLPEFELWLVNTGNRTVSTGECVHHVQKNFANDSALWDAFESVTKQMDEALVKQDVAGIKAAVRENHQLLTQIGIVPKRVQKFVTEFETLGGAAKVCGAGTIKGEHAGILLAIPETLESLETLCKTYGYELIPIKPVAQGTHVA